MRDSALFWLFGAVLIQFYGPTSGLFEVCEQGSCHPRSGNLLVGRKDRLSASSTCGQSGPETYCIHGPGGRRDCHVCDKSSSRTQHEIDNIVGDGSHRNRWWQSASEVENVTIRLDLEAHFEFTYLFVRFRSRRPAAMSIEKSDDFGQTWTAYQYFARDCEKSFPGAPRKRMKLSDAICETRHSDFEPETNGEVIFRALPADLTLQGGNIDETYGHMQMTNLRVNLSAFPAELDAAKRPDGAYYAISEMIVRGLCSCHGHSSHCLGSETDLDMVGSTCICEHNTVGKYCEQCKSQYRDAPWRRAQGSKTNACQACRCNGHSRQCRFDAQLYEKTGSGGVCENCQHNTSGNNCELCQTGYYRDLNKKLSDPDVCIPRVLGHAVNQAASRCSIDLARDINATSPLILDKNTLNIAYPDKETPKLLTFKSGQERLLYCSGGQLLKPNSSLDSRSGTIQCRSDSSLVVGKKSSDPDNFKQISCSKSPEPLAKDDAGHECQGGRVVNLGYQLNASLFVKTIDLCYSADLATTLWSHARIPAVIGASRFANDFKTPAFSKGAYFQNVLMTQVYPQSSQQKTFLRIFDNDRSLVDRYLPTDGKKNYLVKGHLVARADLFYPAEQLSTYFYLNVLPMWQSINNGNWKSVESLVRRHASESGSDLDVWIGGLGVLQLSGRRVYLARDKRDDSKQLVPVPKLLYKLVHDRPRNEALVFVTVNNPYLEGAVVPSEYRLCREHQPCRDRYPHLDKFYEGYTYCCRPDDFLASPELKNVKLPIELKNAKIMTLDR
uniref:Laminin N-terminal domain-containing protein n=1 Tax=Trichogramma kaykai TaxID=54128 RepID=A0ABD2XA79_9HYME